MMYSHSACENVVFISWLTILLEELFPFAKKELAPPYSKLLSPGN